MIGDMLEARTREGPVMIFGWILINAKVYFLVVTPDGRPRQIAMDEVSIDWHHDATNGWVRDFEPPSEG